MAARLDVAGGWVDVRERLKVKDERAVIDFISPYMKGGPVEDFEATIAFMPANALARSAARLVAWSIPDVKTLPPAATFTQKVAALEDLYPEVFKALWEAVSKFESEQKKETEEKNVPADGVTA